MNGSLGVATQAINDNRTSDGEPPERMKKVAGRGRERERWCQVRILGYRWQ